MCCQTDIPPIVWDTNILVAKNTVKELMQYSGKLENETRNLLHYRVLTSFFGFPDDRTVSFGS